MALFLKVLADIAKQRKFITAGPAASWLWLAGVGHCRLSSTDGFIHALVVPTLVPGMKSTTKHAEVLVRVGLWLEHEDGFLVKDYLDWNPSKAELDQMKREDAERKRTGRRKDDSPVSVGNPNGIRPDVSRVRADAPPVGASSPSPSAELSGFDDPKEIPISTEPPAWGPRSSRRGSLVGLEGTHRLNCAPWAFTACQRGVCVPKYLWPQWELRKPVEELRAFVDAWAERAASAGDKPEKFWPVAFEAHFGTAAPQPVSTHTKGSRAVDAMDRAYEAIQAQKAGKP